MVFKLTFSQQRMTRLIFSELSNDHTAIDGRGSAQPEDVLR